MHLHGTHYVCIVKIHFRCSNRQKYLTSQRAPLNLNQEKVYLYSHNNRHFCKCQYQANPYYSIVLLNAFIGPEPVKRNGNLFDNSTLKKKPHTHITAQTPAHTHACTLASSRSVKQPNPGQVIPPHAPQMYVPPLLMQWRMVMYVIIIYVYCLRTCHYAQLYYHFGKKSISAPCLFIRMIFQMILFQMSIYKQIIIIILYHPYNV